MNWITEPPILSGKHVELIPLDEAHLEQLEQLAQDQRIWEFIAVDMSTPEKRLATFKNAFLEQEKGTQVPFVILHKSSNQLIGSTRLMEIHAKHQKLEIGWTWLHPDYWATVINLECKLLLLTYAFEKLKTIRVQLKTDENNIRSQTAIRKIGAQVEGILRNDQIRDNGTKRNTVYFSILDSEWERAKINLINLMKAKNTNPLTQHV